MRGVALEVLTHIRSRVNGSRPAGGDPGRTAFPGLRLLDAASVHPVDVEFV